LSQSSDKAVGDAIAAANARWDFAGDVAKGFDSHIERSVPGYREVHELIASMSDFFVRDGSLVYEFIECDLLEHSLQPASLTVVCFTMQFVQPAVRQQLFDTIYASLEWGGALLLFEKVRAPDARFQDLMSSLYTDYKQDQGFSDAEIIAKSRSLKGVLEPFSTQGNLDLMSRAGFVDVMSVWKRLCFEGFLAIK